MARNFSERIVYNRKALLAVFVPQYRKDGLYYEVNIPEYPRFYVTWSPLGRYDIVTDETGKIPYELILTISDVLEKKRK